MRVAALPVRTVCQCIGDWSDTLLLTLLSTADFDHQLRESTRQYHQASCTLQKRQLLPDATPSHLRHCNNMTRPRDGVLNCGSSCVSRT